VVGYPRAFDHAGFLFGVNPVKLEELNVGLILLIVLIVLLMGGLPRWEYSRNWGYGPSGGLGLLVVVLLILVLAGYVPRGF
jgi:hypothetical protein